MDQSEKKERVPSQIRAGITLPPFKIKTEMKKIHKRPISKKAFVYTAASVEFFIQYILKQAMLQAKTKKQKKGQKINIIESRGLYLAMENNEPLKNFLTSSNAVILSAGVQPEAIEKINREKKVKKEINEIKKNTTKQIKEKKIV